MRNAIDWFEIPTIDLDRAVAFYEKVLDVRLKRERFGDMDMAIFTAEDRAVGGAIVLDPRRKPSGDGSLIYLNANGRLDEALAAVAPAGGQIVLPKTDIGEPGFIALVRDREGNVVGLHSERK
jgi:predicted enzyme related to lactoylglutathione lyase